MMIEYKFREAELIEEFKRYIDSTYSGHYGQGGLQSSEIIVDRGHCMGFFSGNVDKYNGRYGKKGDSPDDHRKDIMKIIHYGFLMLYEHDRLNKESVNDGLVINLSDPLDYDPLVTMGDCQIGLTDTVVTIGGDSITINPNPTTTVHCSDVEYSSGDGQISIDFSEDDDKLLI